MKKCCLLCFLFLSFNLFCQDSPFINFGIELNSKIYSLNPNEKEHLELSSILSGSVTGVVYYNFNPKYSIQTGLSFNRNQLILKDYSLILPCDFISNTGAFGLNYENSWTSLAYTTYYIGFPTKIKWNLSQKNNRFYLKLGEELWLRLSKKGDLTIHHCRNPFAFVPLDGSNFEASRFLILLNFGIGYEFNLTKGNFLYIEPNIEYSLNSIFVEEGSFFFFDSDLFLNNQILNIGIAMGISF